MSFPSWFIGVGDFKFTQLFVPILQVIMFCMGTTLSAHDFLRVFRMPTGVLIGLGCQFSIMPLVGLGLAIVFGLPPEIAAGTVLVGASPSGLASNVMSFIAKADVAMSVTLTAIATLLAPLLTPLLMKTLAGQMIEIDTVSMMWSITKMVILPILGGLIFHHCFLVRIEWLESLLHKTGGETFYSRLHENMSVWVERIMPPISMLGIIAMTVLTVAIGRDNLLQRGALLIVVCFLHSTAGYILGYAACRILRRDRLTSRTIALEVGMQNSGMASGIAATLDKVATLGLAPIVFGPVMNTTASVLANYWRTHPVEKPAN